MPLENGHRDMIEATIGHLFYLRHTPEQALIIEIIKIKEAIDRQVDNQHDYEQLSRVFHEPSVIRRIDNYGQGVITVGEVREGVLEFVNKKLIELVEKICPESVAEIKGKLDDLGWNYDTLLETARAKPDRANHLITEPLRAIDWQWWLQDMQQLQEMQIQAALATQNGQLLTGQGLLTQEIGVRLGIDRINILISDNGRQLLEGEAPRLTAQQALQIDSNLIDAMTRITDITFEEVITLNIYQVKGRLLGLSREQVQVSNFSSYTVDGIEKLMERNPELSLRDAYERFQGLNFDQVDGILLGLSREQVQVSNFSSYTVDGIEKLMEENPTLSLRDAYERVQGLNFDQVEGILLGLSREQVEGARRRGITPPTGSHVGQQAQNSRMI